VLDKGYRPPKHSSREEKQVLRTTTRSWCRGPGLPLVARQQPAEAGGWQAGEAARGDGDRHIGEEDPAQVAGHAHFLLQLLVALQDQLALTDSQRTPEGQDGLQVLPAAGSRDTESYYHRGHKGLKQEGTEPPGLR